MAGAAEFIDLRELEAAFEAIGKPINWQPALKGISLILQNAAKDCFDQQHDPQGNPWAPLAPATIARRRLGRADRQAVKLGNRGPGLGRGNVRRIERRIRERRQELEARGLNAGQAKGLARAQVEREHRQNGSVASIFGILSARDVKILLDTGTLRSSVASQGQGHFEEVTIGPTDATLIFGTNIEYAGVHQNGWPDRHIPARPFLGVNEQTSQEISELVSQHIERHLAA